MNKYGESLKFYLVDVKDIQSEVACSAFNEEELAQLADTIIATGCLLKPLILKQISLIRYQVLEGHFEYHAAVLANQKDVQRVLSGMVSAFVVKPEIEAIAIEQSHILNKTASSSASTPQLSSTDVPSINLTNILETRLNNLESRFERESQEARANNTQALETIIRKLQKIEEGQQNLEEVVKKIQINHIKQPPIENTRITKESIDSDILYALNNWDKAEFMKLPNIGKVTAEQIIKGRPFKDLQDVINRKVTKYPERTIERIRLEFK